MSEELCKYSCFDTMTSQQLETILRLDAEGAGNLDTDSLFYIMELLAARQTEGRSPEEAYAEFRTEYLPHRQREGKRRWWAVAGAAAALAAMILLAVAVFPAAPRPAQPREFVLQNLDANAVAIVDDSGNCAALGNLLCDDTTVTASIDAIDLDDGYDYYAIVTYSYFATGTGNLMSEQFPVSTAETGFAVKQVFLSVDRGIQVHSVSGAFYVVEKGGTGEAKLIAAVEAFPHPENQILPDKGFY